MEGLSGVLVIEEGIPDPKHSATFLMNLRDGARIKLHDDDDWFYDVKPAPGGDRIAYVHAVHEGKKSSLRLEVANSAGMVLDLSTNDVAHGVIGWLNSDELLLRGLRDVPGTQYTMAYPVVLDLTDRIRRPLLPDFPDLTKYIPPIDFWRGGPVVYDPSLSRAVYAAGNDADRLIIYDLNAGASIASVSIGGFPPVWPRWSPDGIYLAIVRAQDSQLASLEVVGRDSSPARSFMLARSMDTVVENSLAWSPASDKLAFLVYDLEEFSDAGTVRTYPVVADLRTGELAEHRVYGAPYALAPIWSPDGDWLLIETTSPSGSPCTALLNLESGADGASRLGSSQAPLAWLVE